MKKTLVVLIGVLGLFVVGLAIYNNISRTVSNSTATSTSTGTIETASNTPQTNSQPLRFDNLRLNPKME